MLDNANCFPPVGQFDGKTYIRLSVQIYNEMSDYEYMATKFLEYLAKHKKQ
jgi:hypothetical protein